ncbi:MAG: hypothetical protein ABGW87_00065 [Sphingomonadaceae bacterium]
MIGRRLMRLAITAAAALLACTASARDLVLLHETQHHNRILLDRDSLTVSKQFDRVLREGIVSLDNSVSTAAVNVYAADVGVQTDCVAGQLAVLYARAYAPDGSPAPSSLTPTPHELAKPADLFERIAYKGICQSQ